MPKTLQLFYVLFFHNNFWKELRYESHCRSEYIFVPCGKSDEDHVWSKHVVDIRIITVLCLDKILSASLIIYEHNESEMSKKRLCFNWILWMATI